MVRSRFASAYGCRLAALALVAALGSDPTTAEDTAQPTPPLEPAPETEILLLSGQGFDDARPWDFRCSEGRRCQGLDGPWDSIPVPSQWEQHGFGNYNYGHDEDKHDESAEYRLKFRVPEHWQGRRIEVVFDGVMTDTEVSLDGELVGTRHQGGFYRFHRDLTGRVEAGREHELGVRVWKVSSDRSVELAERDADYWVFGGIFRPVWLRATPEWAIDRVAIDAGHDGRFSARIGLHGLDTTPDAPTALRLTLEDLETQAVAPPVELELDDPLTDPSQQIEARFDDVLSWSAEAPHLYLARFELYRGETLLHRVRQRFGFRTIELRPDGLYVNDRRTRLRGINRHAFWPESGRTVSAELDRRDAETIRALGFNAVRASHYPPDEPFLDACDELGLYVIDELAGWHDAYSTRTGRPLIEAMIERDVNHPSILLWANGNEDGWNTQLDSDYHLHDPQYRPVLHPRSYQSRQPQRPGLPTWNLDLPHYPNAQELATTLDDQSLLSRWRRNRDGHAPLVLPTESLHGLYDGGSGASLADYWQKITDSQRGIGLFLWVFTDEAIRRTDRDPSSTGPVLDTDGNHAPDGILGPYREPTGQIEAIRQTFAPVQITPVQGEARSGQAVWDGTLRVRNHLVHQDLADIQLVWELLPPTRPTDASASPDAGFGGSIRGASEAAAELETGSEERTDAQIPSTDAGSGGRIRGASTERTCTSKTEIESEKTSKERTDTPGETEPARVEHRAQPADPSAQIPSTDAGSGGRIRGASTERTCASKTEIESTKSSKERTDTPGETEPARVEHRAQPADPSAQHRALSGSFALPSLPTDSEVTITLPLPANFQDCGSIRIRAVDTRHLAPDHTRGWQPGDPRAEARRELFDLRFPLHRAIDEARDRRRDPGPAVMIEDEGEVLRISAGDRGLELAADGSPRALIGPDLRLLLPEPAPSGSGAPPSPIALHRFEDGVEVAYDGLQLRWQVFPSGWVRLAWRGDTRMTGPTHLPGLILPFDEAEIQQLCFVGYGPDRIWGNRPQGRWGSHCKTKEGALEPRWAHEPQWRGYYRARRANLRTSNGVLGLAFEDDDSVLGLFAPRFPDDSKTATAGVHRPDGLAFLDTAPGIGTKFSTPEELGADGTEVIEGLYGGAVWLWAGEPSRSATPDDRDR